MKTTKKNLTKTRVELTITLNADDIAPAADKALARLANNLKVSGFRKGKVPLDVAKKHIPENDLASQTLDFAVRTALPKAFEGLHPISIPEISVDKYVPGEIIEFRAASDVIPEIKLGNYRALKAKKPDGQLPASSVDEVLNNIAKSFAEKKVANRPAKLTDEVQIDFTGTLGGKPFDGGSAKDFKLTLGSNQFIPGFEQGIIKHSPGDKFELKLTFPKDYHAAPLAGKKVTFEVLLKQINELNLPPIDDALAQKAGPFKTLKDLKADIKRSLQAQSQHTATEHYKDALVNELVNSSTVDAPETLIADQLRFINLDFEQNLKAHNLTREQYFKQGQKTEEDWEKEANMAAQNRVKAALVLQVLARELDISATDDEVSAKLAELRDVYKKDETASKNLADPRVHADIKNRITIEKTLDELVKINSK